MVRATYLTQAEIAHRAKKQEKIRDLKNKIREKFKIGDTFYFQESNEPTDRKKFPYYCNRDCVFLGVAAFEASNGYITLRAWYYYVDDQIWPKKKTLKEQYVNLETFLKQAVLKSSVEL